MKKLIVIIVSVILTLSSFGQVVSVSTVNDSDFRFGGRMTNELFIKLTPSEQNLYLGCLSSLGLKMGSVEWCDNEFIRQMSSHEISPSLKVSWKFTNGIEDGVEILKIGTDTLFNPKCIVFIKRVKENTMFTFQMYY